MEQLLHKAIDVEARRLQFSTEYEKGIVSTCRRFDHGSHGGVPVETEIKRNSKSICKTNYCVHGF